MNYDSRIKSLMEQVSLSLKLAMEQLVNEVKQDEYQDRKNLEKLAKGTIWINNNIKEIFIPSKDLQKFILEGWKKGRIK